MRRALAAVLCLLLVGVLFLTQTGVSQSALPKTIRIGYPSYEKLDREAAGLAATAKGKELADPQHRAYLKPVTADQVLPKTVDSEQRGIAILIDFPETEPGVSEVTDCRFARLPESMFNELLNGDVYNPYAYPDFAYLATFTDKWTNKVYTAPTDSTLKNYFDEVSYGQLSLSVDLTPWLTMPHPYAYYLGQDKGHYNENGDALMYELIADAIDAADAAGVEFADYARLAQPGDFSDLYGSATSFTDGDGNVITQVVPNISIIHRGTGAEYYGAPTGNSIIWSHQWSLVGAEYYGRYYQTGTYPSDSELAIKVVDGVAVNTYNICPEVGGNLRAEAAKPYPPAVGVFAHEFSHVLGVPDQYDYGYESEGTGFFSLMAGGSSGRDIPRPMYSGTIPVHLDAWSKIQLGFIKPEAVKTVTPADGRTTVTLRPLALEGDVCRIDVPGSDGHEYFLLENRQQLGFDRGLGHSYYADYNNSDANFYDRSQLHGLVIYHINSDTFARSYDRANEAQNWDNNHRGLRDSRWFAWTNERHYAISVLQADGRFDMERGLNDGDAADVFPGVKGITLLGAKANLPVNTTSLMQWHPGTNETGIQIENISEGADGLVTFTVTFANTR